MPVVMQKKPGGGPAQKAGGSDKSALKASVPTPVFVAVILVVLLVVAVLAYRAFAPERANWDNAREGAPVTRSALQEPPPVTRSPAGTSGAAQQEQQPQQPAGTELPPDTP